MIAIAGTALLCLFLKYLTCRKRPKIIKAFFRVIKPSRQEFFHSMPSGDAMLAAVFFMPYAYFYNQYYVPVIAVIWVGLGRVYVQCHWLGDVFVGSILGVLIGVLMFGSYFPDFIKPFVQSYVLKK